MTAGLTLFDDLRLDLDTAIELTAQAVNAYAHVSPHWVVTFSGGKDSTATLTVLHWLIESGHVPRPESLTALYADTRMELPPLHHAAMGQLAHLAERGVRTRVVQPPMDKRFWVYMLGRGVPPPGAHFRWCTGIMKLEPMQAALASLSADLGQFLVMTGVRIGESAARDARIAISCSKDGSECGQGYFQQEIQGQGAMLAPIVHWRVCNIFDWLTNQNVGYAHGYPTLDVAAIYGGDEAAEINARTGCVGCPVANRDKGLEVVVQIPEWAHLRPLLELRGLWEDMRADNVRLRKRGERKKDGSLTGNGDRKGPMTLEARLMFLDRVLELQGRVNAGKPAHLPVFELINAEEEARIRHLISVGTWPDRWTGDEPRADEFFYRSQIAEGGQLPLIGDLA